MPIIDIIEDIMDVSASSNEACLVLNNYAHFQEQYPIFEFNQNESSSAIDNDAAPLHRQNSNQGCVKSFSNSRKMAYRSHQSLPDRLSAECLAARSEAHRRCREPAHVKFADEMGEILNTFVMIPSRQRSTKRAVGTQRRAINSSNGIGGNSEASNYGNELEDAYLLADSTFTGYEHRTDSITEMSDSTSCDNSHVSNESTSRIFPASSETNIALSIGSGSAESMVKITSEINLIQDSLTEIDSTSDNDSTSSEMIFCESNHLIKLLFTQPFACIETFKDKLNTKMICLENVRVHEDKSNTSERLNCYAPAIPTSVHNLNSTILCSIKVVNVHWVKKVFARCTDDHWVTSADLPAQYVPDVNNLGYEFDTFCFAVRRPVGVTLLNEREQPVEGIAAGDVSKGVPTNTVEFALCYEVLGETYWDNNDGRNYGIEWF